MYNPTQTACFLLAVILLAGCTASKSGTGNTDSARLDALQQAMTGSFDSSTQADTDPEYYNIVLHMEPIWTDKPGRYLYVEQAVAGDQENPYRQRVYKLETQGRKLVSRVYELPDPKQFVGAHDDPERFALISPADIVEKVGCAVYLKPDKLGVYRGSTKKKSCKSSLRGATYATSRVSIGTSFVQSWDRGFNDEDEQVWGATKGGYLFFRQQ